MFVYEIIGAKQWDIMVWRGEERGGGGQKPGVGGTGGGFKQTKK
jgi:hypothetical protein